MILKTSNMKCRTRYKRAHVRYHFYMTEEHRKKLSWTKPCRGFMIIAYNRNDPSEVYGYHPKQARFYRNQGYVYRYRGKQDSDMLNNLIETLHSMKVRPTKWTKWIKRRHIENVDSPYTQIGSYFWFRKHLNRHLELKIIRISSDNCEYLATGVVPGSSWPMVFIELRQSVIESYRNMSNPEPEKTAIANHYGTLKYAVKACG